MFMIKIYIDHKNITCIFYNTDRVLKQILILEEYGLGKQYIQSKKNIVIDAISRWPKNGSQESTQESIYTTEIV